MSAIRLTGKMVNFNRLTVLTDDLEAVAAELRGLSDLGPVNVILDSAVPQPLSPLLALLRSQDFGVLAVVEGVLASEARDLSLAVLSGDRPMQRVQVQQAQPMASSPPVSPVAQPAPAATAVGAPAGRTIVHQSMLRTGQQLVGDEGDVVLIGDMNSGSELIAGGSVHIYGSAAGRIIAGCNGQHDARIFCQKFDAELVSLGGTYCLSENMPEDLRKQAVWISLNASDELVFSPLKPLD